MSIGWKVGKQNVCNKICLLHIICGEYYSVIKRNKVPIHTLTQMNFENSMLK